MIACLTGDEVEAFVSGSLPAEDRTRFESHLTSCPICRSAIEACARDRELAHGIQQAFGRSVVGDSEATPARDHDDTRSVNDSLDGYEILHEIHRGGQGVVYKAVQLATKRTVALKVLLHGPYASPSQQHRFEREIDLIASLQHPNIVTVYDSGLAHGRHYFAMEYIHGQPLDGYLSRTRSSVEATLRLFQKICAAVNAAHQHGVIHRDLKPGNIRIDAEGEPHILDFGLAKAAGPDLQSGVPVTMSGEFMGTLPYASPEQARGDPRSVDIRTDVYSLGVIIFEMLTGVRPYDVTGSMAEVLRNILEVEPKRPSSIRREINDEVDTIVLKALAKERERRYQSAETLARDVGRYLAGEAIEAKRDSAFYVLRKAVTRHRRWVAAGGLLLAVLVVFAVVSFEQAQKNRRLAASEGAARALADETSARLAKELVTSTIERGRLFTRAGNLLAAEDLLWREQLKDPHSIHSYWALWELYSRNPSLAMFDGHGQEVRDISFAADGRTFATAADDGRVMLWNAETFAPAGRLVGHTGSVRAIAFSPDGRRIASASMDGSVKVWKVATGRIEHDLRGHEGGVWAVDFADNGGRIVSGGADTQLRVWDADTGDCIRVIREHWAPIAAVRYNGTTRVLATVSKDCIFKLWDDLAGPPIATLTGGEAARGTLAFSRDGRMLAWGGEDSRVTNVWHLTEPPAMDAFGIPDNGNVRFVDFGPADRTLISGGWYRVDEWDLSTHSRRTLITLGAFGGAVSPDGCAVVTGTAAGSVRVTDRRANAGEIRLGGQSNVGVASVSPDGRIVACGDDTNRVRLWDTATGKLLTTLPSATGRWSSAHFHPSGKALAACGVDGVVRMWNLDTKRPVFTFDGVHVTSGQSVSFSPDGRKLAVTRPDGTVRIHDAATGDALTSLPPTGREILAVRYSPDGGSIATTYRGKKLVVWSADGGSSRTFELDATPWTVGFSPDSRKLAVGCWGRQFQIWDLESDTPVARLGAAKVVNWGATYMPTDTSILATCSGDGTVGLWDLSEGRNILTLEPFGASDALSVAFTPDGKTLVASGFDGSLCLWDLEYFDRHIAGNLEYQIDRLRGELGDAIQAEYVRTWAADVMRRSWPRIGPHAAAAAGGLTPSAAD